MLWTVQFWLNYGINNKSWKPDIEKIYSILDNLIINWIYYLDTAPAYWDSEEIIWKYIKEKNINFKIFSKFSGLNNDNKDIFNSIKNSILKSLKKLNVNTLEWYLLHNAKDFYNTEILNSLLKIKDEWLIKNIWVSIYEIEDALNISKNSKIDYIQIPFNILDQRLNNTEFFNNCKINKIKVIARSIFLQWLILMKNEDIPEDLKWVIPYLEKFDKIILKYWLTRVEACMLYTLQNEKIDFLLFWVDNLEQLSQNLNIANKNIDFSKGIKEIENNFKNIDKYIISPNLWNNK